MSKTITVHNRIAKNLLHHEYFVSIKTAQYVMPTKYFPGYDFTTRTKEKVQSNQY